ncbi:MAG: DUF3494 domain-containing protein [Herpetosiphonaceae bacterium]|nr:DUF3494 domain-containing protein [Herpetosiphonaceae bacterium]
MLVASLLLIPRAVSAASRPDLGTAASFAVLGASTVTNTGPTVVHGDLGVSPGTAVTGFPPGLVSAPGTIHAGDAVAAQAERDALAAYNDLAGQACNVNLTGQDLGGLTLTPAGYCFSSSAQLTGQVTLDAQGNPNAVFIFQIGSTLSSASNSKVLLINGASPCNVFWQVGGSATLGTATSFEGNILALASIARTMGTTTQGGLYALNGAVTLDTNDITVPVCSGPTAISLVSFTATPAGQAIVVQWTTATELNTVGFNLYRSVDGERKDAVRVTPSMIPAEGNGIVGSTYAWTDTNVQKGSTYSYWLQETETAGTTNEYGPTTSTFGSYHILLPLMGMGSLSR